MSWDPYEAFGCGQAGEYKVKDQPSYPCAVVLWMLMESYFYPSCFGIPLHGTTSSNSRSLYACNRNSHSLLNHVRVPCRLHSSLSQPHILSYSTLHFTSISQSTVHPTSTEPVSFASISHSQIITFISTFLLPHCRGL